MRCSGVEFGLGEFADQPAMLAARRLFHFLYFPKSDLEIVAQLAPDARLDGRQAGGMKLRSGDVAKFGDARLVLVELDGVQVVEDRVVHVESGEGNPPALAADQKFLFAPGHIDRRRPGILETRGVLRLGEANIV